MKKTEIILLGVLHNFHEQVPVYSLDALKVILQKINPEIICAELTELEVTRKEEQPYKQEYSVIFPYSESNKVKIIGMDPEEPLYTELVDPYNKNQKRFQTEEPDKYKALEIQQSQLYDFLINEHWKTPIEVQSKVTHYLMDLKHRFQEELLGEEEKKGWNAFNRYYKDKITRIAKDHQGSRILITIGIEHIYWLQKELKTNLSLDIIDTELILTSI